jgi:hypothetical protein
MPSADSCAPIRSPYDFLSSFRNGTQASPGKLDRLRRTPAGSTALAFDLLSSITAQGFYMRLGYQPVQDVFHGEERTILMRKAFTVADPCQPKRGDLAVYAMVALLSVGGRAPLSVRCTWKRRTSSAVAVSGERPRNLAKFANPSILKTERPLVISSQLDLYPSPSTAPARSALPR